MAGVEPSGTYSRISGRVAEATECRDIDLLYQHRVDPAVPVEEVVGTMADLVKEVKFAISVCRKYLLRRCAGPARYIRSLPCRRNIRYGAASRRPVFSTCRELGSALCHTARLAGFLTGTITDPGVLAADDFRRHLPRFQAETMRKTSCCLSACSRWPPAMTRPLRRLPLHG